MNKIITRAPKKNAKKNAKSKDQEPFAPYITTSDEDNADFKKVNELN